MKLLAIDTATEACSAALWIDGRVIERFEVSGRGHSLLLPTMVPELMAEAGLKMSALDGLVCGIGPGSFAGVRIGVSYIKGLALGLDRPVVGVTSLAMLAQAALQDSSGSIALAAIDARMNEVYFAAYRNVDGRAKPLEPELVCPPEMIPTAGMDGSNLIAVGTGWDAYRDSLLVKLPRAPGSIDGAALPHAAQAFPIAVSDFEAGKASSAAGLLPIYLRNRVALTKLEQVAARAEAAATNR